MSVGAAPEGALIRGQLARLVENPRFASAPKLRAFLEFIVERTLSGEASEIKEYTVALAVYGRREDYDPKTDSIVRVEAGRLRHRLSEYYATDGAHDPVVVELPKGSYVPVFRQRVIEEPPPVEQVTAPVVVTPPKRRWVAALLAATTVLIAVVLMLVRWSRPGAAPTIAIAPFNNLSLDPANDALTRELSKNVEVELTRSGKLKVLGAGKSDLTLEASVRRRADRILVIAQLLDRRDGSYIWSDSFERESSEAASLMADTARRIAADVESQAMLASRHRAEGGSARGKALELYRLGKAQLRPKDDGFLLRGRESYERPSMEAATRAIGYLEQSVAADPTFAAGWSTLATYYQMAGDIDPRMLEKAVASARKAIAIDPKLGEAHAILGYIDFLYYWKFNDAAEEFRVALEHEPHLPATHRLYADCLNLLGRNDEAVADIQRALILYPGHPTVETARVLLHFKAGPAKEMENAARRLVARMPQYQLAHWTLGLALEQTGDHAGAIREFETCLHLSPGDGRCVPALGHAYAMAGRARDAERMLETIQNRPATQTRAPYEMALIQTALKRDDAAVANLQSAFDQRELGFPYLKVEPRFARLRQRAEVKALLAKIGL